MSLTTLWKVFCPDLGRCLRRFSSHSAGRCFCRLEPDTAFGGFSDPTVGRCFKRFKNVRWTLVCARFLLVIRTNVGTFFTYGCRRIPAYSTLSYSVSLRGTAVQFHGVLTAFYAINGERKIRRYTRVKNAELSVGINTRIRAFTRRHELQ